MKSSPGRIPFAPIMMLAGAVLSTAACTKTKVQPEHPEQGAEAPVVEATLEWEGPGGQWAGPEPLRIQIRAEASGKPEVSVQGPFDRAEYRAAGAALLGSPGMESPTVEGARNQLTELARIGRNEKTEFRECLHPVRARLVRSDRSVEEVLGCRGSGEFARQLSRLTSLWLEVVAMEAAQDKKPAAVAATRQDFDQV
jgi:hypothetical protein